MDFDSALKGLTEPSHLEAFVKQWSDVSTGTTVRYPNAKDSYWNPRSGAWEVYKRPEYTVSEQGIPSPGITLFLEAEKVYKLVEVSWARIRGDHPNAVFDPRARLWKVAVSASGRNGDVAERARKCEDELKDLDHQYRDLHLLNHDEWEKRRHEIRQKWGFE